MIASDASSSYSNGHITKEHFAYELTKNNVEEDELGIYGAEKYFKGVLDEELLTSDKGVRYHPNQQQEKHEVSCGLPKSKTLSSVRSDSSWNSRKGLLDGNESNQNKKTSFKSWFSSIGCNCNDKDSEKITEVKLPVEGCDLGQKTSFRDFLANLCCNCSGTNSVKIAEVKQMVKAGDLGRKTKSLSSRWADDDGNIRIEDCLTFPVLNPSMADAKHPKLPEVDQEYERKKSFRLERKLNMLNINGATPKTETLALSNEGQNDAGSDASSDLFEIESFSTNENNLFLAQPATENNGDAPSEASIHWSVVTAGVSDSRAPEDRKIITKQTLGDERISNILSKCTNLKTVRVSGDEQGVISGGQTAAVIVSPTRREWSHRLDSATPVAKIQADSRLIGAGTDLHRSQIGVRVARSVHVHQTHSTHALNHSYNMQKK